MVVTPNVGKLIQALPASDMAEIISAARSSGKLNCASGSNGAADTLPAVSCSDFDHRAPITHVLAASSGGPAMTDLLAGRCNDVRHMVGAAADFRHSGLKFTQSHYLPNVLRALALELPTMAEVGLTPDVFTYGCVRPRWHRTEIVKRLSVEIAQKAGGA